MAGAAFFDLDRTLLHGASGPLLSRALVDAGISPDRRIPGQDLLYRFYEVVGETLPSMALARGAALAARGWSAEAVRKAAEEVAEQLETMVAPFARPLLKEHRAKGRPTVLATTTPHDLVAPLARRLGFDDVVATRYDERDGSYTGRLAGEFVWATGKLAAVRRWAATQDVAMGASFAYSDSIYDLPLLSAVGHPHAVNPDVRLHAVAVLRRWPVLHLDVPPGVPKLAGLEPFDLLRLVVRPELFPYARFDIDGAELVPEDGGAILASNHRSYFDVAALALTAVRAGRALRFLGKREVFDAPVIGPLARSLGGIPVDRDTTSGGPLRSAALAVEGGEVVAVLPQGTIPRGRAFFDPELKGKSGAARLAAMTGAPVVPVGVWGTEAVWPRRSRLPNVTNVLHPPTVTVRVGGAVQLAYDDPRGDTARIMRAITALLPDAARQPVVPTAAQLVAATPPGMDPETAGG